MFTPLSKGSERAQDKLWDKTNSPHRKKARPPIPTTSTPSIPDPFPSLPTTTSKDVDGNGKSKGKGKGKSLGGELRAVTSNLAVGPRYKRKARRLSGVDLDTEENRLKWFFRVWIWVSMPFPVSDPYKDDPFPEIPSWPKRPKENSTYSEPDPSHQDGGKQDNLPLDVNFYFFLIWYFGFLGGHLSRRFPASWLRFLWFMTCLAIACFSLIAGQDDVASIQQRFSLRFSLDPQPL
ncbi:uncharacterized protein IL334_005556 [Kwoniella shivajii]|uniref:Uncharacterized protein n=1 Tax=Kwoniella shivajii TaxID=564305 RepID=A0ABZ1D445_9TREE|nr:hypothetical protein IL334_005556 [Kwoniella shivajii]